MKANTYASLLIIRNGCKSGASCVCHVHTQDWMNAIKEMSQAVAYLRASGASKVGVVGFCMGGALSYTAAQHCGVNAAVPFYGTPQKQLCQVGHLGSNATHQ